MSMRPPLAAFDYSPVFVILHCVRCGGIIKGPYHETHGTAICKRCMEEDVGAVNAEAMCENVKPDSWMESKQ